MPGSVRCRPPGAPLSVPTCISRLIFESVFLSVFEHFSAVFESFKGSFLSHF